MKLELVSINWRMAYLLKIHTLLMDSFFYYFCSSSEFSVSYIHFNNCYIMYAAFARGFSCSVLITQWLFGTLVERTRRESIDWDTSDTSLGETRMYQWGDVKESFRGILEGEVEEDLKRTGERLLDKIWCIYSSLKWWPLIGYCGGEASLFLLARGRLTLGWEWLVC